MDVTKKVPCIPKVGQRNKIAVINGRGRKWRVGGPTMSSDRSALFFGQWGNPKEGYMRTIRFIIKSPCRAISVLFNNSLLSTSTMSAWQRYAGDISVPRPLQDGKSTSGAESRDNSVPQKPSKYSQYINMLLELDKIPWWHNLLASLCTWLLLAGYVVLPGAFTSIRNSQVLSEEAGAAGKAVVKAAQTLPVLIVALICCAIGVSGMAWLWCRWGRNYVWLLNKIIV